MELRALLIEAIQRAESVGINHGDDRVLVLVEQPEGSDKPRRTSWTLSEARVQLATMDGYATARMN